MIRLFSKKTTRELALEWTREMWQEELWKSINWLGVPIHQWPTDLLVLQELIYEQKPEIIIETGTYKGGTAVFFASILTLLENDRIVISIENKLLNKVKENIKEHPMGKRIKLIEGDSTNLHTINKIKKITKGKKNIMVFLDSDHSYDHVLHELRIYEQFIPLNGYMCVFDTSIKDFYDLEHAHPNWKFDNPHRAVEEFIKENGCFKIDKSRTRLLVTFAPDGFLKRVK